MAANSLDDLSHIISRGMDAFSPVKELVDETGKAIGRLYGERYHAKSRKAVRDRSLNQAEGKSPFAGLVHPDSPDSGAYGGMSLVWFPIPAEDSRPGCSLLTFVCGTRGLSPDEHILGRPGHVRHLRALARFLGKEAGVFVWTKQDPTNLLQPMPEVIKSLWAHFRQPITEYGTHIYAAVEVPQDAAKAHIVVGSVLDLYAWERGWQILKAAEPDVEKLKNKLRTNLFPLINRSQVYELLRERKFVIIQGPPGTGKSRMATELLDIEFKKRGEAIQFHPAVAYETFVAGIGPAVQEKQLRFEVAPGALVRAIGAATNGDYLLVIDEINRADLSRVLGEAIYLLEPREISEGRSREVSLPHALPDGTRKISIPNNLFILGTMNSADRSIAILDLAVRRRFAFVDLWPDTRPIEETGNELAVKAFGQLQDIFTQYAPADALVLLPGQSYFIARTEAELRNRLRFELIPLLTEYLHEGRLGQCESELRAYIDWLEGELHG